jgi:succinate dehydrogenase / fumarate reductase cytochrome b subunit
VAENPLSWMDRHHFVLRRLHSLSGILPIGAFLINHLLTNATAFLGPGRFDEHVRWLHSLPFLTAIEILFIFLPLLFHGAYGIKIALEGRINVRQYPYMDNWRYTLQRVTAWIMVAFILLHLAHFRFAHWFGGMDYKAARPFFFSFTQQGFEGLWLPKWAWMVAYGVGLAATVYHFCNGLVTFCITWGITIGVQARKRMSVAAGLLGAVLLTWGALSLYALGTMKPPVQGTPTACAPTAAQR